MLSAEDLKKSEDIFRQMSLHLGRTVPANKLEEKLFTHLFLQKKVSLGWRGGQLWALENFASAKHSPNISAPAV